MVGGWFLVRHYDAVVRRAPRVVGPAGEQPPLRYNMFVSYIYIDTYLGLTLKDSGLTLTPTPNPIYMRRWFSGRAAPPTV